VIQKLLKKDDQKLFMDAVGDVTPIKSNKYNPTPAKPKPYPKEKPQLESDKFTLMQTGSIQALEAEDTLSFTAPGLQKNVLKKLRKGYYGLDAELDLHGLTSQQAKHELNKFLHYCEQDGCRSIRIIHGKGYRSENNLPVLKNDINLWLRQHQEVQAFCSTAQKDGGTGAVIVLLRLSSKYTNQDDSE